MSSASKEHTCVFGLGWGDEGKGKIVDLLCPAFDLIVRFNGGANAGHTVCVGDETFALHLLPSGVLHGHTIGVIGPGVVVDPIMLLSEIDSLVTRGIDVIDRLRISDRAHLVMPYHQLEDRLSEGVADPHTRIGTTARGIGPCYADKMKRTAAIRFADLLHDTTLSERVRKIVSDRRTALAALYGSDVELDTDVIVANLATAKNRLSACVCDTTELLGQAMQAGQTVLFEGANGMLLDVDHGTYPFVTSSNTGPHSIGSGAGVSLWQVTRRIGTIKSYATRVGSGPFVTEQPGEIGDRIRERGKEFGTTTGRPRRCGWFDAVSCLYTARISGVTDIALMHLDTLTGFDPIGLCTAYRIDGESVTAWPAHQTRLDRAEPVFEFMPGWNENLRSIRRFDDLPAAALAYIQRIEALVGTPVTMVGVGPDRSQTLVRGPLSDLIKVPQPMTA